MHIKNRSQKFSFGKEHKPKLLEQVRIHLRSLHYSPRTEESYPAIAGWIKRFILYHGKKHPKELNEEHVQKFPDYLSLQKNYSPSTQSVTLNSIVFLYKYVIGSPIGDFSSYQKAKT